MTKINVEQVVAIKIYLKREHIWYFWQPKKVSFGITMKKEGYYPINSLLGSILTKEQIEEDKELYCEDNKVYYKPYLDLYLSNGKSQSIEFETRQELLDYVDKTFSHLNLIDV